MIIIAAPEQVVVPEGSWIGNVGSFGLALILFGGGIFMAKKEILLWGPFVGKFLDKLFTFKKGTPEQFSFDWKSLVSFILGFWGVVSLFGAGGPISDWVVERITAIFSWFGDTAVGAALGMGTICFFVLLFTLNKAFKEKGDNISDIKMGSVCGIFFSFGGGSFLWFYGLMANSLNELLGAVPMSS